VLNARNDEVEAEIIADAGALGAVTVSTNRQKGTDIKTCGKDGRERLKSLDWRFVYYKGQTGTNSRD
jgi:preprotein translocase subunit SecA